MRFPSPRFRVHPVAVSYTHLDVYKRQPWKIAVDGSFLHSLELACWAPSTGFCKARGLSAWSRRFGPPLRFGDGRGRRGQSEPAVNRRIGYARRNSSSILGSMFPPLMMATPSLVGGS